MNARTQGTEGTKNAMPHFSYVSTVIAKGRRYHYSRFPAHFGMPSVRLADNFEKAKIEAAALLVDQIRSSALGAYLKSLLWRSSRRATEKGMEHGLTEADLIHMLVSNCGKCAVTGIEFDLILGEDAFDRPFAPSIDRIENSQGYTPDNCRLVCRIVNFAMGAWGYNALREIAHAITAIDPPTTKKRAVRSSPTFAINPAILGHISLTDPGRLKSRRQRGNYRRFKQISLAMADHEAR